MFKLEISAYNIEEVKAALRLGVDRLELCANIKEGGTTPSYGFVEAALATGHSNVFIIIRPRGGDFLYSDDEFEVMKAEIAIARKIGVHGVVCGLLNADGSIDIVRTKQLIELAKPMNFTFHRAFDMCNNPAKGLEELISIGVNTILTSGMEETALKGKEALKKLVEQAAGRINILAGSGVSAQNIETLHHTAKVQEFHMSAVKEMDSAMQFKNDRLSMGNCKSEEYKKLTVDTDKIKNAIAVINQLKEKHDV